MKSFSSFVVAALCFIPFVVSAQSQTVSLTIITNPPQGGTVGGAGAYTPGTDVAEQVQAAPNWYIKEVLLNGTEGTNFQRLKQITAFTDAFQNFPIDYTTITSEKESAIIDSNSVVTVTFDVISPTFAAVPTNTIVVAGASATLFQPVVGRQPLSYQWQFNGTNVAGATNTSLSLTNCQTSTAGNYTLNARNTSGTNTSPPLSLNVENFVISTNLVPEDGDAISSIGNVIISFETSFTNASIFYTTDGTPPDFNSIEYFDDFYITNSCELRAIAYSADFTQSVLSSDLQITVIPVYSVWAGFNEGGAIRLSPANITYTNGELVTATALPNPGWTFMNWAGSLAGTNPVVSFVVTGNAVIAANFGTTLRTTATGGGTVSVTPQVNLYPLGANVEVVAVPNPSNYFVRWGNSASGTQNPLLFAIDSSSQSISALFSALPPNEVQMTAFAHGGGSVSLNPATNHIALGNIVTLAATPFTNQIFLGWSGDASGITNPLSVLMDSSKTITAEFSHTPTISITASYEGSPILIRVFGVDGASWELDSSTNLTDWTMLLAGTNFYSSSDYASFLDSSWTNTPFRAYRAISP